MNTVEHLIKLKYYNVAHNIMTSSYMKRGSV